MRHGARVLRQFFLCVSLWIFAVVKKCIQKAHHGRQNVPSSETLAVRNPLPHQGAVTGQVLRECVTQRTALGRLVTAPLVLERAEKPP